MTCLPKENEENLEREERIAGPKFDLLATATLRLEEAGEEVDDFSLRIFFYHLRTSLVTTSSGTESRVLHGGK